MQIEIRIKYLDWKFWSFYMLFSNFQKKNHCTFNCFFGHFTSCWTTYHSLSILKTVCNSLHSLNIGSLPNSRHFLLNESSSFLTFWTRKLPLKFCLWEKFSLPFSLELSEEFCFYPKQAFLFPKNIVCLLYWQRTKLPKYWQKICVY